MRPSLHSISDSSKIVVTLLFCLAGLLLFLIIGVAINLSFFGADAINAITEPNLSNPDTITMLKIAQISQTIGLFVVPGFVLAYLFSPSVGAYLGLNKTSLTTIILSVAIAIFSLPAINLLASINQLLPLPDWMMRLEENAMQLTKAFLKTPGLTSYMLNIFMVAILPAVGEELIFRGILQKHFINITRSAVLGIIVTSALFSLLHFQFQGFIPRFALGVMFGFLYVWSGTIWLPIVAHFTNNAVAVTGYMLISRGEVSEKIEKIGGLEEIWPVGLISLLVVVALLWEIRCDRVTTQ